MKNLVVVCSFVVFLIAPVYSNVSSSITPNSDLLVFSAKPETVIYSRLPDPKSRQQSSIKTADIHDFSSLTQILNSAPAIYTQGYGNGKALNINFHGFADKANTLVLLDGVKINDPQNSSVLWSAVPMDNVERIELLSGGSSFIYGEGALAGAVNIITRKTPQMSNVLPVGFSVDYMMGSHDKRNGTYSVYQSAELFNWYLSSSSSDGNTFRQNSFFKDNNYFFKSNLNLAPVNFKFQRQYVDSFSNLPGPLNATQNQFDQSISSYSSSAQYREKLWANTLSLLCDIDVRQNIKLQYSDRERTQYSYIFQPMPYDMNARSWALEYAGRAGGGCWVMGSEYAVESLALLGSSPADTQRKIGGVYASSVLPLTDRISLNLSGRYDKASVYYTNLITGYDLSWNPVLKTGALKMSGFSPQVAVDYKLSDDSKLHAGVSRAFKVTPFEDFGVLVNSISTHYKSNLTIEPQVAHNTEIGYTIDNNNYKFEINYYYMYLPGEILYNPITGANENCKTFHAGEEINLRYAFDKNFLIKSALVFDRAEYLSGVNKGNDLPFVNSSRFYASVEVLPIENLTINLGYHANGSYYPINDARNNSRQPGYSYFDLKGDYGFGNVVFYGGVNNLFNSNYQASVVDYGWGPLDYYPANKIEMYTGVKLKI